MKNMALELHLKGDDPRTDGDVLCIAMITFAFDEKSDHQKCSKCKAKNSGIHIRVNDIEIKHNPGWIPKEKIENRAKNIINKIQAKLKPNCMGIGCFTVFYNDFSSHVHKRGHKILD